MMACNILIFGTGRSYDGPGSVTCLLESSGATSTHSVSSTNTETLDGTQARSSSSYRGAVMLSVPDTASSSKPM